MDAVQLQQHDEYGFPYHYLPRLTRRGYRAFRNWDWSLSYVVALKLIAARLEKFRSSRHIDVGCGDGALLSYLRPLLPDTKFIGVDYDPQAIAFAKLLTPQVEYHAGDIGEMRFETPFTSASLVEVLEHIPPDDVPGFMAKVRSVLTDDARVVVTVPHVNKPTENKHYRHFSFKSLEEAVSGDFEIADIYGFERVDRWQKRLNKMFNNRYFYIDSNPINAFMLRRELGLRSLDEKGCGRIFAELRCRRSH